jgi:hypothetical protein
MERGELASEPELTSGLHRENKQTRPRSLSKDESGVESKRKGRVEKVEEDEFFGDDNDAEV